MWASSPRAHQPASTARSRPQRARRSALALCIPYCAAYSIDVYMKGHMLCVVHCPTFTSSSRFLSGLFKLQPANVISHGCRVWDLNHEACTPVLCPDLGVQCLSNLDALSLMLGIPCTPRLKGLSAVYPEVWANLCLCLLTPWYACTITCHLWHIPVIAINARSHSIHSRIYAFVCIAAAQVCGWSYAELSLRVPP